MPWEWRVQNSRGKTQTWWTRNCSELRGFDQLLISGDHLLPFTSAWNNFSCLANINSPSALPWVINCYFICYTHNGNSPAEIICYLICKPNIKVIYLLFLLVTFHSWQIHIDKPAPVDLKNDACDLSLKYKGFMNQWI